MILNIVTFVVCLAMLILFRRLDKANLRMTKLRRYSNKMFDDFRKLAETEKRKFKDATIEMDILIKKSNALTTNLSGALQEIETRLEGLNVEKGNLKRVEDDLKVISGAARDVNKQIEFIAMARDDFGNTINKVNSLQENMADLRSESGSIISSFNNQVRERSRELLEETTDMINQNHASFIEKEKQVYNLKDTIADLENTVFADIKDKSDEMKESMKETVIEFGGLREGIFEKMDEEIERVHEKLKTVEGSVDESKTNLIKTFEHEVGRVRTELDNLSLHAIAKKDEIVQATRKEAEEIRKRVDDFQDNVMEHENRLISTAETKIDHLDSEYQSIDLKFTSLSEKTKSDFSTMEERLNDIKEEIFRYEEHNNIFTRTDELVDNVDNAVERLQKIFVTTQEEYQEISSFLNQIDDLKEVKKSVNAEIMAYHARKEKLEDIETNIHGLMEAGDLAVTRSDQLQENLSKVDFVNNRMDALSESYTELESRIEELREYEELISQNLTSANKSEAIVKNLDGKLKNYQKVLERSDKRIDKISHNLQDVEEKTIILKTRKAEISELKEKFDEVDGLSEVMEKRVEQIYAMFKKVEDLRMQIDETDNRLQVMYSQTDEKMREFSDFIQAVDAGNPILKQVNQDISFDKNINENVIRTVRELSDRGWGPGEIAKKMLIDENSIRFIINTTSL